MPGLAVKSITDIDVVVDTEPDVRELIERMANLGNERRGNFGLEGREASSGPGDLPRHHMYLCPSGGLALHNHLPVRVYRGRHPETVKQYGDLKKQLAIQFPNDIDRYMKGKSNIIPDILKTQGFYQKQQGLIETVNRK